MKDMLSSFENILYSLFGRVQLEKSEKCANTATFEQGLRKLDFV